MAGVIQGQHPDVISTADLKPIDATVRGDDPWCLLCVASDRADEVERHKADRSGMGKDRDPLAGVDPQDVPQFGRASPQKMSITLAVGDHVVHVSIYQRVIVPGMYLF